MHQAFLFFIRQSKVYAVEIADYRALVFIGQSGFDDFTASGLLYPVIGQFFIDERPELVVFAVQPPAASRQPPAGFVDMDIGTGADSVENGLLLYV